MSDRVTQLQDCLDQLLTQMFASANIPGQADQWADTTPASDGDQQQNPPSTKEPRPDPPALFQSRLRELAQDLVVKEQQIEALVESLPGIGSSQGAQEKRLVELERELREADGEEREWEGERRKLLERVDGWVSGSRIRRV
jgi:mediator of RNA polymerase II transcription subunit 21